MFKKAFLTTSFFVAAYINASYAANTDTYWEPGIPPISCIVGTADGYWKWNHASESCNKVIDKGYAKGVQYSGEHVTADGQRARFDVFVGPHSSVKLNNYRDAEVNTRGGRLENTTAHWVR